MAGHSSAEFAEVLGKTKFLGSVRLNMQPHGEPTKRPERGDSREDKAARLILRVAKATSQDPPLADLGCATGDDIRALTFDVYQHSRKLFFRNSFRDTWSSGGQSLSYNQGETMLDGIGPILEGSAGNPEDTKVHVETSFEITARPGLELLDVLEYCIDQFETTADSNAVAVHRIPETTLRGVAEALAACARVTHAFRPPRGTTASAPIQAQRPISIMWALVSALGYTPNGPQQTHTRACHSPRSGAPICVLGTRFDICSFFSSRQRIFKMDLLDAQRLRAAAVRSEEERAASSARDSLESGYPSPGMRLFGTTRRASGRFAVHQTLAWCPITGAKIRVFSPGTFSSEAEAHVEFCRRLLDLDSMKLAFEALVYWTETGVFRMLDKRCGPPSLSIFTRA